MHIKNGIIVFRDKRRLKIFNFFFDPLKFMIDLFFMLRNLHRHLLEPGHVKVRLIVFIGEYKVLPFIKIDFLIVIVKSALPLLMPTFRFAHHKLKSII